MHGGGGPKRKDQVEERGGAEEKDEGETLKGYSMTSETIRKLKQIQQRKRITLTELWDEDKNIFVSDEDEMAETIKAARRRLEHTQSQPEEEEAGEAEPDMDKELLEGWEANFTKCRTRLESREIEIIILDQKAGKSLPAIKNILRGMGRAVRGQVDDRYGGSDGTENLVSLAEG